MTTKHPHLIVIAGPNGAGKSTTAPFLLKGTLHVTEFVNEDSWVFYDNSVAKPTLIAYSNHAQGLIVPDSIIWHTIVKEYGSKRET